MIAWTLISLAGCSASAPVTTTPVTKQPFRGQEVVLLVPKSLNLSAVWEILIQEWSSQSGATARFVEYETSAALKNEDTLNRELQQEDMLKGGIEQPVESGGTLVLFPFNRFCDLPRNLSPLTVREGEFDAKDIFKGLRERVLTREQKLVSNPVSVPVLSCYYRRDLLRAANKAAPETWEDYDELVASVGQWAPGLIATEPLGPEFRATTFFARSLAYCKHPENYSVWFDLETGQPTIDTPGFERALEMAAQTWTRLPVESRSHTPAECRNLILAGKAAITLAFEPSDAELTSHTSDGNAAKIERAEGIEIGVCRIPGTRMAYNRNSKKWDSISAKSIHAPALCGFAGLASAVIVPGSTKDDCAAMNLLATLSTADVFDRAFSSLPKSACRESQLSFAPAWYGPELATEEASLYCDAVAESLRDSQLVYELPVTGSIEFRRAAAMALDPLLRGESDPKQTLLTMQKLFAEIVERLGPETVRDSHRKGLGLSPVQKR